MATAKALQVPQIISIQGSSIRIAHPDISMYNKTYLSSQIAAAGTAMTVQDNNGFADNDWMIVGVVGDQETETTDVNGAVTRGTSMTVTNYLSFAHELDAEVTKIYERAVKIYGVNTETNTGGTLIASIDAITASGRQLADSVMLDWKSPYTKYSLISTDTAYSYYYCTFYDGTTESSASDPVAAAGLGTNTVEYFVQQALTMTSSKADGELIRREDLIKQANDCQTAITQFKYQDPTNGRFVQMNWDFEVLEDTTSLSVTTGEDRYALSGLTVAPKFESERCIIGLRIATQGVLSKLGLTEYDKETEKYTRTDCATTGAVAATSLVVDSVVEFATSGTLYSGDNTITYTGVTGTTTFTGIPASGTGSIETEIAVDDAVWQGIQLGLPDKYTYFDGSIMFNMPPKNTYSGYPIKLRYFKKLPALTEASDTTEVNFPNVFQLYLASWIERRKGNEDKAVLYMNEFKDNVLSNALASNVPTHDSQDYYNFITSDNANKWDSRTKF